MQPILKDELYIHVHVGQTEKLSLKTKNHLNEIL